MMVQTIIADFSPHRSDGNNSYISRKPTNLVFPVAPFSIAEACKWAEEFVFSLPTGTTFTSMRLFAGIRLRGDKRARGVVLNHLRRLGLITVNGLTQEDQEGRNNGYAALWEVV